MMTKFKHVHFIINPACGKQEPILSYINQIMAEAGIDWDVSVTKKNRGAGEIARELIGRTDLVAAYGGDGCVTAVASALHRSDLPLAIIPGGTANVMAKELGMPLDTEAALSLLLKGKHRLLAVDMGLVNGIPFILRVNMGIMADMVTEADRDLKNMIGQFAYGVTAVQTLVAAKSVNYRLKIDGQQISTDGVSLTVTNAGHMGIGDLALLPGISLTDGRLDVIVMKENSLTAILKVAGSALLQNEAEALLHWKAKKVEITMPARQSVICDDTEILAKKMIIEVAPGAIRLLIPVQNNH